MQNRMKQLLRCHAIDVKHILTFSQNRSKHKPQQMHLKHYKSSNFKKKKSTTFKTLEAAVTLSLAIISMSRHRRTVTSYNTVGDRPWFTFYGSPNQILEESASHHLTPACRFGSHFPVGDLQDLRVRVMHEAHVLAPTCPMAAQNKIVVSE